MLGALRFRRGADRRLLSLREPGAFGEDQDAVSLPVEPRGQHPDTVDLTVAVARPASHEVRRHPAGADVERRQRLELALERVAKVEIVRTADELRRQAVVDDARVTREHDHGASSDQLVSLHVEAHAAHATDARDVACTPRHLELVRAPPPGGTVASPGAAGEQPDAEQAEKAAQLHEQEPPDEEDETDAHPRLAPPQPEHAVDSCSSKEKERREYGEHEEQDALDGDPPNDAQPTLAGRPVRLDQR